MFIYKIYNNPNQSTFNLFHHHPWDIYLYMRNCIEQNLDLIKARIFNIGPSNINL